MIGQSGEVSVRPMRLLGFLRSSADDKRPCSQHASGFGKRSGPVTKMTDDVDTDCAVKGRVLVWQIFSRCGCERKLYRQLGRSTAQHVGSNIAEDHTETSLVERKREIAGSAAEVEKQPIPGWSKRYEQRID